MERKARKTTTNRLIPVGGKDEERATAGKCKLVNASEVQPQQARVKGKELQTEEEP